MTFSDMFKPKEFTYKGYGAQRDFHDVAEGRPEARSHYWVLRGPRGAVTFQCDSFELPPVMALSEYIGLYDDKAGRQYMGNILMWHDPHEPPEENYDGHQENCCFLDGHPCWNGGSGIAAYELLHMLAETMNEDMVWEAMLNFYITIFGANT